MSEDPGQSSKRVKVLIHKARGYLERGEPREAIKLFRQVLTIEPNHPHVQQWLTKLQGRMKKPVVVGAPAEGSVPRGDETILSTVQTDVHPANLGSNGPAQAGPPKPRLGRGRLSDTPSVEMDTTAPGMRSADPVEADTAVPALRSDTVADFDPVLDETTAPGRKLQEPEEPEAAEAIAEEVDATAPGLQKTSPLTTAPEPLDTTDPDVNALLAGAGRAPLARRLRPVLIGVGAMLLLGLCFSAFNRHSGRYRVQLEPDSPELPVARGAFFFSGWQEPKKVAVGYDAGWQQRLGQPELLAELREGKVFESGPEVDHFIVSLYRRLGETALSQQSATNVLEAIYYFKQARRVYERQRPLPPEELEVRKQLVATLFQLSDHHAGRGEVAQAKDSLEQARHYDPTNPEIADRMTRLLEPPPPLPTPTPEPEKGKKSDKKRGQSSR